MKNSFYVFGMLLLFVITSCSSVTIDSDYDPEIDFSSYKTFSFFDGKGRENDALAANPLVKKRVMSSIENALIAKGFEKVDSDPDFVVISHAGTTDKLQVTNYGYGTYGYGRYRYGYGWGLNTGYTDVREYTETTLVVDVGDYAKKELVWRGSATGVVKKYNDQEELQERIDNVIGKILSNFPPQKN